MSRVLTHGVGLLAKHSTKSRGGKHATNDLRSGASAAGRSGRSSQVRAGDEEDKQAAQEIAAMLRDSGKIRNYNVGIKYKKGTVWLEGHVASEEQMEEVLMQVGDLDEVTQIVNNLTIGTPAPPPAQKSKSGRRVPITRGMPETQLASAQRPITRGVPLGMATGGGAAPRHTTSRWRPDVPARRWRTDAGSNARTDAGPNVRPNAGSNGRPGFRWRGRAAAASVHAGSERIASAGGL